MFDSLVNLVQTSFNKVKDYRISPDYTMTDALMSGFAMFSLKDPSLLSFIENYPTRKENLEQVYKIADDPSEQGLRKILDPINPDQLLPTFKSIYEDEKVAEVVNDYKCFSSLGGYTAIAVDGTGYFCSNTIKCPHCMVRKLKSGPQYYHQLAGACIVNPNKKTVFPVFAEPITKQDGSTKNDCEYNAVKRLVPKITQVLPNARHLLLLDGLFATGPAIRLILFYSMDFISVIKDGYVLVQAKALAEKGQLKTKTWYKNKYTKCTAKWANRLILNGANQDLKVDYVEYEQVDIRTGKVIYAGKWITSLNVEDSMIVEFVHVARTRWKIENETFNVLKNQGYNLEHNYGHGKQFLSSLFATLMLLAFLVDQLTQTLDKAFQKALIAAKTLRDFRQKVRVLFDLIPCISMNLIYQIIARDLKIGLSP
ncbi:MAG: transposase [Bacteroidota bacterium]